MKVCPMPTTHLHTLSRSLIVLCSLVILLCSSAFAAISPQERTETYKKLEIFSNVLSILQDNYVEEIDSNEVLNGAIKGLLYSLDPHSSYLSPADFKEFQEESSGIFSGIGIEVTTKDDLLTVVSAIADTPADRAGFQPNDIILEIDGEKTKKLGPYEAIRRLRGPAGSEVKISIHRKGWSGVKTFTMVREIIPLESVTAEFLSPGFVYSRITNFQSNTSGDYRARLAELSEQQPIKGLILDLRNNPGGLLHQSVDIVDIFLSKGTIVSTRGRRADQNNVYTAHNSNRDINFPLVVLVNQGSASASEIVAGAIQAHKRGIIVGTRTFGKGSVQTIIPLPDGAGLRMTTATYYTPDDKSIQALGIVPDVEVPLLAGAPADDDNNQPLSEADLAHHLPGEQEQQLEQSSNRQLEERLSRDNQLRSAFNILKSLNLYSQFTTKD
jgi:carboxyl-terminal processing protease